MIRRPPRSTLSSSSAASDVYKRQALPPRRSTGKSARSRPERVIAETPTAADATGGRRALDPAGGKPVHGVPLPEPSCLGSYGHSNFTTEGQQTVADRETGRSCGHECPGHQPRPPWARTEAGTGTGEPTPARPATFGAVCAVGELSLIHISEPTRLLSISYAVF